MTILHTKTVPNKKISAKKLTEIVPKVGFEPTRAFRPKGLQRILGTNQSCLYYPPV